MRPGQSNVYSSYGGSIDLDSSQYNTMMKLRSLGKWHLELKSTTCDYGLYPSSSNNEVQTTRQMEMGKFKTAS